MPSDHMRSITILLQLKVLHDKALQSICSCSTVGSKNETILDTLIFICAREGDFLLLCDVLQSLSEETAMNEAVEAFRNGMNLNLQILLICYALMHASEWSRMILHIYQKCLILTQWLLNL